MTAGTTSVIGIRISKTINQEQLVKRKNSSEFNSNNKTSKRVVLDPQEKTTLEIQPSINQHKRKRIQRQKQKMKLQLEAENEILFYMNSAREQ